MRKWILGLLCVVSGVYAYSILSYKIHYNRVPMYVGSLSSLPQTKCWYHEDCEPEILEDVRTTFKTLQDIETYQLMSKAETLTIMHYCTLSDDPDCTMKALVEFISGASTHLMTLATSRGMLEYDPRAWLNDVHTYNARR